MTFKHKTMFTLNTKIKFDHTKKPIVIDRYNGLIKRNNYDTITIVQRYDFQPNNR